MWGTIASFFSKPKEKKEVKMDNEIEKAEKELKERIIKHEGLRLKPYKCPAGKLTIGVGRNIEDNGISESEAYYMLDNDIAQCTLDLFNNFPWVKNMTPRRQGVLIEMIFNMGIARFKQFKNMLALCEKGDFEGAAKQALDSLWAKQVGKRATTLAQVLKEG